MEPTIAGRLAALLLISATLLAQGAVPRSLDFPRHGLRVTLPPEWSVSQWNPAVIAHFARDTARVGIYPAGTTAQQLWELSGGEGAPPRGWKLPDGAGSGGVTGSSVHFDQRSAWLGRAGGDPATAPVVLARPTGDEAALRLFLEGVRRARYGNSRRYVDWSRGFSFDVPEGWVRVRDGETQKNTERLRTRWIPAAAAADPSRATLSFRIAGARDTGGAPAFPQGLVTPAERRRIIDLVVPQGEGSPTLWDERWSVVLSQDEALERRFRWRGLTSPGKTASRVLVGRVVGGFVVWLDVARSSAPREEAQQTAQQMNAALESFVARADAGGGKAAASRASARRGFGREDSPPVSFVLPRHWKEQKSGSRMRLATWRIDEASGLDLIVYFFGKGDGGTAKANTDRWVGQIEPRTKQSVDELALSAGIRATVVDVSGTYSAAVRPGSSERANRPGSRLLAATIEFEGGPLFFKLVGSEAAVQRVHEDVVGWLKSFRLDQR